MLLRRTVESKMMYVKRAHEITIDRPLEDTLPLFTPKGEEAWVPGWEPEYIAPETGQTCREMLFVTNHGDETTYWTCLSWQPDDGHVRYLRLTPESRVGFVDVQCRAEGSNRTRIRVAYELHALTDAGRTYLGNLTQSTCVDMIDGWARSIKKTG
jgi:hypothetical protein